MGKSDSATTRNDGGVDPAALAVASFTAAVSIIAPPGPYGPASMMIGATILVVIFAYEVAPRRTLSQSIAFGGVCALISLLALGYPLEYAFATDKEKRFRALFAELPQGEDLGHSEVWPWVVLTLWVIMTAVYSWIDRRRAGKRQALS